VPGLHRRRGPPRPRGALRPPEPLPPPAGPRLLPRHHGPPALRLVQGLPDDRRRGRGCRGRGRGRGRGRPVPQRAAVPRPAAQAAGVADPPRPDGVARRLDGLHLHPSEQPGRAHAGGTHVFAHHPRLLALVGAAAALAARPRHWRDRRGRGRSSAVQGRAQQAARVGGAARGRGPLGAVAVGLAEHAGGEGPRDQGLRGLFALRDCGGGEREGEGEGEGEGETGPRGRRGQQQ
jgi:hypothetical protein